MGIIDPMVVLNPIADVLEAPPTVAVEVGEGFGVVSDHGVEVKRLRVGEIGVGDRSGDCRVPRGGLLKIVDMADGERISVRQV